MTASLRVSRLDPGHHEHRQTGCRREQADGRHEVLVDAAHLGARLEVGLLEHRLVVPPHHRAGDRSPGSPRRVVEVASRVGELRVAQDPHQDAVEHGAGRDQGHHQAAADPRQQDVAEPQRVALGASRRAHPVEHPDGRADSEGDGAGPRLVTGRQHGVAAGEHQRRQRGTEEPRQADHGGHESGERPGQVVQPRAFGGHEAAVQPPVQAPHCSPDHEAGQGPRGLWAHVDGPGERGLQAGDRHDERRQGGRGHVEGPADRDPLERVLRGAAAATRAPGRGRAAGPPR